MTSVAACIPSIGLSPHLYGLANLLCTDDVAVRVYVNSVAVDLDRSLLDPSVEVVHMPGDSIYVEWNHAARWAGDDYLLAMNDDIVMLPGTANALAEALDNHPDYGLISVGDPVPMIEPVEVFEIGHQLGNRGAFHSWCFIARPEAWQDVNPRYRIWFGDDDLLWKMRDAGWKCGALRGVGVTHHISTTSQRVGWVARAAQEDSVLWASTRP